MVLNSSTTVYAGVPIGTTPLLGSGSYKPMLALANFGTTAAHVTVALSTTIADSPQRAVLTTAAVPAGHSMMLTLPVKQGSPELQNSFVITADAAAGSVMTKLVAISDGPLHEVELLGKDQEDPPNAGQHPWSDRDGSEATLLLFDHSDSGQSVRVSIGYSGGIWQKTYQIQSMATLAISVRALVEQEIPDDGGHLLPSGLDEGAIVWKATRGTIAGRLLQSDAATAMARSFSCYLYYYIGGPVTISNGNPTITVGDHATLGPSQAHELGSDQGYCDSLGDDQGAYHGAIYSWSDQGPNNNLSWDTNDGSGWTVQGTAAGQENVEVSMEDANCGTYADSTVTVSTAIPSSETTALYGTINITKGVFVMSLNPGTYNYDGHNVSEHNYATGTNSCYWTGANMVQYPSVSGDTWLVGGDGSSHNHYGLDSIGFASDAVNYIQQNAPEHDVDMPCVVTFYQLMAFEIDANTYQGYVQNVLTQTIGSNTVNVCRAGVCTGTIQF